MTTQAVQCQCNCRHLTHPSLVTPTPTSTTTSTTTPTPVSLAQVVSTPPTAAPMVVPTTAPVPSSSQVESALQSINAQGKQSQLQNLLTSTQVGYLTSYQTSHNQTDITNFLNSLSPKQSQEIVSLASGSSASPSVAATAATATTATTAYGTTTTKTTTKPTSTSTAPATSSNLQMALQLVAAQGKQSQLQSILTSSQINDLKMYQANTTTNPNKAMSYMNSFLDSLTSSQKDQILKLAGLASVTPTTTTTTTTTTTATNFCSQFNLPCEAPEPFASMIDIITAAQYLEKAIHDSSIPIMLSHLNSVTTNLSYARDYFQGINDTAMVNRIQSVINAVEGLKTTANKLKKSQLTTFQKVTLYGFQGVIGALYQEVKNYSLPTAGSGY